MIMRSRAPHPQPTSDCNMARKASLGKILQERDEYRKEPTSFQGEMKDNKDSSEVLGFKELEKTIASRP